MAPTERQERRRLYRALREISAWLEPGTNEGANFLLTRLTGPLDEGSLFGGADISRWTPGGRRGSLQSQGGTAFALGFGGATPASFPLDAEVDLNKGKVSLQWTPPNQPTQSATFTLEFVKKVRPPNGPSYFFDADTTSDQAVYAFTVVLL